MFSVLLSLFLDDESVRRLETMPESWNLRKLLLFVMYFSYDHIFIHFSQFIGHHIFPFSQFIGHHMIPSDAVMLSYTPTSNPCRYYLGSSPVVALVLLLALNPFCLPPYACCNHGTKISFFDFETFFASQGRPWSFHGLSPLLGR